MSLENNTALPTSKPSSLELELIWMCQLVHNDFPTLVNMMGILGLSNTITCYF